ncbi:hypothetical protein V6N11_015116 [Hibiscus sabdariffa]|uniref:rRNA biogenesis protein RRP36 n=1 Tax=Hibiscus sabdariffa TaxID=183260 RepID=A0ABR2TRP7_9ROSI
MKRPFNSIATSSKTHFEESEEDEEMESSSQEEESDDSIDSDEEEEIERELAEVTFEELQKERANGTDSVSRKPRSDAKHRRANKNRPMELSSKKSVRSFRQVIQAPKKVARDPPDQFSTLVRCNFYCPAQSLTTLEVQKRLKRITDPKVISELKNHISWIDKQLKFESAKNTDAEILAASQASFLS